MNNSIINRKKYHFIIISLFMGLLICPHASAKEPIELSVAVYREDGNYVKPFGRTIRITQQPLPFRIILKNVSTDPVKLWDKAMSAADDAIQLEITNEKNRKIIIQKKRKYLSANMSTFGYLAPESSKYIDMLIDPEEWKGVPIIEEGKTKRFKVRAIYKNDTTKIYSAYYEVLLGNE